MDTTTTPTTDTLDSVRAALSDLPADQAAPAMDMLRARVGDAAFKESFFQVLSGSSDGTEKPRPTFRRVGKFLRDVGTPPPMLVDQLLPDHSLILLSGMPKGGKTYAALDLADCVVMGRPVWGHYAVSRPGPVAYLLMEDGEYEGANRLLGRGIRPDDPRPLYVCTDRIILSHIDSLAMYEEMVAELEADAGTAPVLYVIDTAREGLGIKDWNDPAEVGDKLRPIREFARRRGTVLLIAHNKKGIGVNEGEEISGTNSFTSSVDGWISMKRVETQKPSGNRRMWLSIVGRGSMNGETCIEMDSKNYHFRYVSEEERAEEGKAKKAAEVDIATQRIVAAINAEPNKRATIKQIAARVGDTEDNVRQDVKDAERFGYIVDTGERVGNGGRGPRPTLYAVSPKWIEANGKEGEG